jgi:ligand-binding sensor domain-containing protein
VTSGQAKNSILCSYKDSEGNLWFGTPDGLSKLDSERFAHYAESDQMGQRVYSIIEAINGNILCGTSLGGTTVFDGQHYSLLDQREGFTSSVVQCFYYSADSSLWIGTYDDGIYKFAKSGLFHYTSEEGLSSDNISGFVFDDKEHLWIASPDSGVMVATTKNDSLSVIKKINSRNGLSSNRINCVTYNGSMIWLGTDDAGVIKINDDNNMAITSSDVGTQRVTVHSIIADSLHRVYAATSQGIRIYNGDQMYLLSRANGLSSKVI